MPNVDKHTPGSFCWVELGASDQAAAKQFYQQLFGWKYREFPMGPSDIYTIFQIDGRDAAAAYTLRADQKAMGVPPHWLVYVTVQNTDQTAARVPELGGQVLAGPFDVGENGRMAVLRDTAGAVFAIWQPISHAGIGISGVEGTLCWAELGTPETDKAKAFYSALFGWEIALSEHDSSGYLHIKNGEEFIGGVPPAKYLPPNVPPHWLAYFLVSDCDASAAKAKELGAKLHVEPMSIEHVGRMAVVADPQGAVFAIFTPEQRPAQS